ncbi:MAG: hypothetical protein KJ749_12960 [Planctomycetes bacterium]|nr:hypothetical protein [Planctomycetota bacterium]
MAQTHKNQKLEADLAAMLGRAFPGITVEVGHHDRWQQMAVTFCWAGFVDLLPEERFRRLVNVIPEEFRKSRTEGLIWLELAPSESVDEFLKLPRSEDVADREAEIYSDLVRMGFFDRLGKSLGPSPEQGCSGGFAQTVEVLSTKGYPPAKICDAKLVFIRHGAYCDCQVLQSVRAVLAELHTGAA